jgi:hypothetical protein
MDLRPLGAFDANDPDTTKTRSGHKSDRNPTLQRASDSILCRLRSSYTQGAVHPTPMCPVDPCKGGARNAKSREKPRKIAKSVENNRAGTGTERDGTGDRGPEHRDRHGQRKIEAQSKGSDIAMFERVRITRHRALYRSAQAGHLHDVRRPRHHAKRHHGKKAQCKKPGAVFRPGYPQKLQIARSCPSHVS